MSIYDNQPASLKSLGLSETWLRDWIIEKPSRLGLGNISIKAVEVQHATKSGGRLDILAYQADVDTYYEIELMLGEVNADHGFRCLDYWARERIKKPDARHVAVLVAEDLSGRYQTVIDTLPNFLPFIAIELRVLTLCNETNAATIVPLIIAQPDELILGSPDVPVAESATAGAITPRDRVWWEEQATPTYLATVDALIDLCSKHCGPSTMDFTASSYISLKKGRRCWLPMWKRQNGVYVYLPGGPGGAEDAPSDFYQEVAKALAEMGLEQPSWSFKYNAGANPIGFAIPYEKAQHSLLLDILKQAYQLV
ncbi:MAG TPA: hypothetical protein VFY83_16955 [Anaerolineales bacterium]|nr:hypothetical protein [Anaerolineales bacterium]